MFDSISAHEFYKKFIFKMLPSSLMIVLGALNLLKMFLYINLTTVMASFLGQVVASTHLDT